MFPEYWPRGPGTHRTLLQSPHGPVPEFCLALPWRTAAGRTRHSFLVSIYTLELDRTNFPRILTPMGQREQQYTQFALGLALELWPRVSYPGVRTTFSHMATPTPRVLYPRFLDKTIVYSRILTRRTRYQENLSTIIIRSRLWTLPGSPLANRGWGHPALVCCAHEPLRAR